MLQEIWLLQPLAIARAGESPEPMDAFDWGPNDLTPAGSARTTILPAETLVVGADGGVCLKPPGGAFTFKDAAGKVKPVCPYFELHGRWTGGAGPITPAILAQNGLTAADLRWSVTFCNHKAFHWTGAETDKVAAVLELAGDDTAPRVLRGVSPAPNGTQYAPLVPAGTFIPLGSVQLTRPNPAFPEFRLRFTPAPGLAYGPINLAARVQSAVDAYGDAKYAALRANPFIEAMFKNNPQWTGFSLPAAQCFLHPGACWPNFSLYQISELNARYLALLPEVNDLAARQKPQMSSELLRFIAGPNGDLRNLPPGLFCWVVDPPDKLMSSLGMADDFGDGVITCTLRPQGASTALVARARVVSAPPLFAVDRRPVTSLADGLADRADRASVRDPGFVTDHFDVTDAEMRDLLDRAYETVGMANLDVMNEYFSVENALRGMRPTSEYTPAQAAARVWAGRVLDSAEDLPLTAVAWDRHRRNTVDVFFDAFLVKTHDFMTRYVREPAEQQRLYDRRMPGLMRGADRRPLTITRRQYDELAAWVAELRKRAGKTP